MRFLSPRSRDSFLAVVSLTLPLSASVSPPRTEYPFVLYKWSVVSMPHRSKQDFVRLTDEALGNGNGSISLVGQRALAYVRARARARERRARTEIFLQIITFNLLVPFIKTNAPGASSRRRPAHKGAHAELFFHIFHRATYIFARARACERENGKERPN